VHRLYVIVSVIVCFSGPLDTLSAGGKEHKEIFTFARVQQGKLRGKEWEKVVLVVIEKWGKYVDDHL
jgi:hypothetical protein